MQATATFTPSRVAINTESEVLIRVVNDTGADFDGPLATTALPTLPYSLEFTDGPNVGDCGSASGIPSGSSCDMTATVRSYDPGTFEWSGSGLGAGYDLTLISAAPLVVYIPARQVRGTVSYSPASVASGGQTTATILLENTTGSAIRQQMSTDDLPALPSGLTLVGQPDLGSCAQAVPLFVSSTCQMTATVTSTTPGNHQWTGTGPDNSTTNTYITLADADGVTVYGAPATIAAVSGSQQSARVLTAFADPLVVEVRDGNDVPIPGVEVTFTAPDSWLTATLSATTVQTDAAGRASVTAAANDSVGDYVVVASVSGVQSTADFGLFNSPLPKAIAGTVSYAPATIASGGEATATIRMTNTAGYTLQHPLSTTPSRADAGRPN